MRAAAKPARDRRLCAQRARRDQRAPPGAWSRRAVVGSHPAPSRVPGLPKGSVRYPCGRAAVAHGLATTRTLLEARRPAAPTNRRRRCVDAHLRPNHVHNGQKTIYRRRKDTLARSRSLLRSSGRALVNTRACPSARRRMLLRRTHRCPLRSPCRSPLRCGRLTSSVVTWSLLSPDSPARRVQLLRVTVTASSISLGSMEKFPLSGCLLSRHWPRKLIFS